MPDQVSIESLSSALGWAVVHFLWQGAIIGALAAATLVSLRGRAAPMRYAVTCGALAACMLAFLATFFLMLRTPGALPPDVAALAFMRAPAGNRTPALLIDAAAWLWTGGVVFFFVRFALQWLGVQRLRTASVSQPDDHWQRVFHALKAELGVSEGVRMLRSGLADTPMVVGWLSPVVLVPVSAFMSLTPDQLRSILAHELTHVRRYDHMANAAQVIIETALFFHPVVWWLSSQARLEREHCCDDAAVLAAGNPRILAEALAQLETLRTTPTRAALAANGGSLMIRINRILGTRPDTRVRSAHWRTVAALTAGAAVAAAGIAQAAAPTAQSDDPIADVLGDAVAIGLSKEQARSIYDVVVFPDSEVAQKIEAELAKMSERIDAAVAAGKLSREDADAKLADVQGRIAEQRDMAFSMDVLGMSRGEAYLASVQARLDRLVKAGEVSGEDADAKMAEVERSILLRKRFTEHYEKVAVELREKVAAGDLTEEQAKAKLAELKEGIGKRMWHAEASRKIEAAVKAGEITREEAAMKRRDIREELGGRAYAESREMDRDGIHRRIEGAVERGDMTREEADAKYRELRGRMGRERGERREPDWDGLRRRMESAVERGDMTREQADAMYRSIRERMAQRNREDHDRDEHGRRGAGEHDIDWDAIVQRLNGAVERGDITREQADERLRGLRERIAHGRRNRDGDHDGDGHDRGDHDGPR